MSDESEMKQAFQELNTHMKLLALTFENYVENTDKTKEDHRGRLEKMETAQNKHHDQIILLEIAEENRVEREKNFTKFAWGVGTTLVVMVIEKGIELIVQFQPHLQTLEHIAK